MTASLSHGRPNTRKLPGQLRRAIDTDSEDEDEDDPSSDPSRPWIAEFDRYFTVVESIPDNMTIVEWWGVRLKPAYFNRFPA